MARKSKKVIENVPDVVEEIEIIEENETEIIKKMLNIKEMK